MLFAFSALCALPLLTQCVHAAVRFRHEAHGLQRQPVDKRQLPVPSVASSDLENIVTLAIEQATPSPTFTTPTPIPTVYSYYYPSPSALPTPITQQSQVETTYIPRITTCKGPPVAFEIVQQSTYPFLNDTSTIYGQGPVTCDTLYYTDTTTLCATTLTGVASIITVSECTQDVTFSSDFGTTLLTPRSAVTGSDGGFSTITAAPSVQLLTTYYMAPWQSLTADSGVLPADVDVKVCHRRPGNDTIEDCIRMEESWVILPVTLTSTYTSYVDLLATLTEGPGEYVVGTVHGQFVGNTTIVSLSTEMILNYAYEAETISRGPRIGPFATASGLAGTPGNAQAIATATLGDAAALPTIQLTSTTTRIRTVELASSTGLPAEQKTTRMDLSTETVYSGTSTIYVDDDLPSITFPSAAIMFAESQAPGVEESALAALLTSEILTTPVVATPPNFLIDSLATTTADVFSSPLWPPGIQSPSSVEAVVVESTLSPLAWFQSSIAEPSSSTQWTPEYAPVTQSPSSGASPVLVPSPVFLHQSSAAFFDDIQPSATQPSSALTKAPSVTSVKTPSFSIKWLNTTTPEHR